MPKKSLLHHIAYLLVIISVLAGSSGARAQTPDVIDPDPMVQNIIDQIDTEEIYDYLRGFAGEQPVWVDGDWYTITDRDSMSGTPILKAAHYLGEQYAENGLEVEYHVWSGSHGPNVIAELPGLINPQDIYIIGGHLDDVGANPSAGAGADDNASGTVAGLIAADILSQYQWGCTLRFVGWTGEEYGLLGSAAYATRSDNLNENIEGYLNLDMIAWNTPASSPEIYLAYNAGMPETLAMAELFADVVDAYNIDLVPELGTSLSGGSDHSSFWDHDYTSILGIEGYDDFNPYYHGSNDTTANTDPVYYTNYIKAAIATFIHYSGCLIPTGIGGLEGHVTATDGGSPIEGAQVTIDDGAGHIFTEMTDPTGYYTRTLLSGTYGLNVSAYGFLTETMTDVAIVTDTVTTIDFSLETAPVHTVNGYVREAGTNAPLDATVEILDAPVDPVSTDPSTGYFSVEVAEGTWTMRASAENHLASIESVEVLDDTQHDFSLTPICFVIDDDVEQGPGEWFVQSPWAQTTSSYHSPTHSWTDSPSGNYGNNINTSLTSPIMDLTGYEGLKLNFWHRYDTESGYDYARVEYSTNGGSSWTEANSYDGNSGGWVEEEIDLTSLDGQANARLRFRLTSDVSLTGDGWYLDDIQVYGGGDACVPQSAPIAEFTSNSPVMFGEVVEFTNLTSGNPVAGYEWDFGDGTAISVEENPTHEYAEVGTYTVVLTATNTLGSDTVSHDVSVTESPDIEVEQMITVTLPLDGSGVHDLVINNIGLEDLEVSEINLATVPWLSLTGVPTLPLTLAPEGSVTILLNFDASSLTPDTYHTTITIASSDPDEPEVEVHVYLVVTADEYRLYLPLVIHQMDIP